MKKARINTQIRVPKVRLIDKDGEQVGIIDTKEALDRAAAVSLDLVEISPNVEPSVCRIMDYGKYMFTKGKHKNQAKKKQKRVHLKEIKFRPTTDIGDYNIKMRKIRAFLINGDKVKVSLRFRGREMQHRELGMALLQRVKKDLGELMIVEQEPKLEGRQMIMVLARSKVDLKTIEEKLALKAVSENGDENAKNENE